MAAQHKRGQTNVFASATSSGAITPSDTAIIDFDAIYVGVVGDLAIVHNEGESAVIYTAVLAGTTLSVAGVQVKATGTTGGAARAGLTWMKW